ncbi:MAG: SAM-dependent methyltransferase [Anaerolineae bacterium]|jgi:methyltransferase (TIGR00027 family)|nr:SAM-dependent methyltransferase [Anaerolineae bacterium]
MSTQGVEAKPSETAFFAALRRAIANKDFDSNRFGPDFLAEYFLPSHFRFFIKFKKIRKNTKDKLNSFLPGLNEYMIARTLHFDGLFVDAMKKEFPQIVLLGAGYDTRAYRFADLNKGTKVIELDAAPTQNWKKKCLQKAKISIPDNVTLTPINFNKESLKDVLEKAGYDAAKKTLFIWEGVSYYLEGESVDATLGFVSKSARPESIIAFDYVVPLTAENENAFGVKKFFESMEKEHDDEALVFAITEGKIETFLEERGLKVIEHLDNEEIEQKLLTDKASLLSHITAAFRFVSASPN